MVTAENEGVILNFIKEYITQKKADNVAVNGNEVRYKGTKSHYRGALFGTVDGGAFTLIQKEDCWYLYYEINLKELAQFGFGMMFFSAILLTLGAMPWWVAIMMTLWGWGMNWFTAVVRHRSLNVEIAERINLLINSNTQPSEQKLTEDEIQEKEKLKSWF